MQVIVHTKVGVFSSNKQTITSDEAESIKEMLRTVARDGDHMVLDTKDGYVVLGRDALKNAVFEVKN